MTKYFGGVEKSVPDGGIINPAVAEIDPRGSGAYYDWSGRVGTYVFSGEQVRCSEDAVLIN